MDNQLVPPPSDPRAIATTPPLSQLPPFTGPIPPPQPLPTTSPSSNGSVGGGGVGSGFAIYTFRIERDWREGEITRFHEGLPQALRTRVFPHASVADGVELIACLLAFLSVYLPACVHAHVIPSRCCRGLYRYKTRKRSLAWWPPCNT